MPLQPQSCWVWGCPSQALGAHDSPNAPALVTWFSVLSSTERHRAHWWQAKRQLPAAPAPCFDAPAAPVEEGGEERGRRHLVHPPPCSWPPPTQLGSWPRAEVPSWETLSENTIKDILKEKITFNLTTLTHFTHLLKNYLPGLVHECMFSCNISLMCILFYFILIFFF